MDQCERIFRVHAYIRVHLFILVSFYTCRTRSALLAMAAAAAAEPISLFSHPFMLGAVGNTGVEVDRQCTCIMHYFKEPANLYVCLCCDCVRATDRQIFSFHDCMASSFLSSSEMQCSQHLLVCMKMSKNESSLTGVTTMRTMRDHHHLHLVPILIYTRSLTHSLTVLYVIT